MLNPSRVDDDPDFQILLRELVADSSRDDDDPDFQTLVANSSSQASDQPGPGIPPYSLSHFAPNSLSSGGQLPVATRVQEVIRQLPADHAHFHAYGSTTLLTSTYDTQNQSATVAEGPGNDVREQPTEQGRSPKAYVLKNRRAQQRFKAKQRVRLHTKML